MSNRPSKLRCGALVGLALFLAHDVPADSILRDEVHRQYKHQSYMLIEEQDAAWLYLFDGEATAMLLAAPLARPTATDLALEMTRSSVASERVLGLVQLAGVDDARALDAGLALLNDANAAVREEARQLVLDHPQGAAVITALGLVDESELPEDADGGK